MARLLMLVVASAVSMLTMRACASESSATKPDDVARIGVEGICANQQAVAAAGSSDDPDPTTVTLPADLAAGLKDADPGAASLLSQAASCETAETTSP